MLAPSRSNEYSGQPCQYQLKTSLQSVCRQDLVQDYLSQCPQAVRTCWFGKKKVNKKGKSNMKKTLREEKKKEEEAERLIKHVALHTEREKKKNSISSYALFFK